MDIDKKFDAMISMANEIKKNQYNEKASQFNEYVECLGIPFNWELGRAGSNSSCPHYFSVGYTLPQSRYSIYLSIAFIDDGVSISLHDVDELSDLEKSIIIHQMDELNSRYKFAQISIHGDLIVFNAYQDFSNLQYHPEVVMKSAEALMQVADSLFMVIKNNI